MAASTIVIFLVSGTSWTVPFDWNNAVNTIEVIGGGASGSACGATNFAPGNGGGAYSSASNITFTPGAVIPYTVGLGGVSVSTNNTGTNGNTGGDTWFGASTFASSTVAAKGGTFGTISGSSVVGGLGGQASAGIGTIKFSGGNGGSGAGGTGGGGAAGPHGAGQSGATAAGSLGSAGGAGDAGSGGVGGTAGATGGNGGTNVTWTSTAGPTAGVGGGGGGTNTNTGGSVTGGSGGLYGAGGGAGSTGGFTVGTSGAGRQGIIVITYLSTFIWQNTSTLSSEQQEWTRRRRMVGY